MRCMLLRHDDNGHTVMVDDLATLQLAEDRLKAVKSMDHKQWFEIVTYADGERDQMLAERKVLV